jgi:hypothetical protein
VDLATPPIDLILRTPFPSYHKPFELAQAMSRSGDDTERCKAIELLEGLCARYPHVVAFGQELVLTLMESGRLEEAELALKRFEKASPILDEEFLCRWGRLFKDRGDEYVRLPWSEARGLEPNPALAAELYRKSLDKYGQAYQIRQGYYPGINKATLLLLLGSLRPAPPDGGTRPELLESAELAERLLLSRAHWQKDQPHDETVWHPATAGEAHLLRQEWADAAGQYREALKRKAITFHARSTMRRQVERILLCFHNLGIEPAPPFDQPALLFSTGTATAEEGPAPAG